MQSRDQPQAHQRFWPRKSRAGPRRVPRSCRVSKDFGSWSVSVAGKAEQMATVVDKLVDIHALEDRSRALFGTDKINREQRKQANKYRPGQHFTHRNG